MTGILAERSNEKRLVGEALIQEADNLACQSHRRNRAKGFLDTNRSRTGEGTISPPSAGRQPAAFWPAVNRSDSMTLGS
jgi:hypothetical protein